MDNRTVNPETDLAPTRLSWIKQSWKTTPWLIVGTVAAMLLLQWLSSTVVLRSTTKLQAELSQSYDTANKIERSIGYGGLIHNFKNYVLRPDEAGYRELALKNAEDTFALIKRLSDSAETIGLQVSMTNTQNMLVSYTQRLDTVSKLSEAGIPPSLIDEEVRFNDEAALQEVQMVLNQLETAFNRRIESWRYRGVLVSMLSTVGTAVLGLFLINVFSRWQRWQRQRDRELGTVAESLIESNDDLSKVNASLSQFAGIVSHDLKAPARHIGTLSQLIAEDRDDALAVEDYVGRIDGQVQHMNMIIDSLLEYTRFGFAEPARENVDVNRLFVDIKDCMQAEIDQGAHITFCVDLDRPVCMDPALMFRVFDNLIGNSVKYTDENEAAHITVSARAEHDRIVFSVSDKGIGIESKFAEKIFEPMIRLHGPQSSYKGVGIGLALAKTIVESHGGGIALDRNYTKGTRIEFWLPNTDRDVQGEAEKSL